MNSSSATSWYSNYDEYKEDPHFFHEYENSFSLDWLEEGAKIDVNTNQEDSACIEIDFSPTYSICFEDQFDTTTQFEYLPSQGLLLNSSVNYLTPRSDFTFTIEEIPTLPFLRNFF